MADIISNNFDYIIFWHISAPVSIGDFAKLDCYRYLHWNNLIKAPVTNIMNFPEYKEYVKEYPINVTAYDGQVIYIEKGDGPGDLIKNNKAGAHGEELTWDEILELYK